VSCSGLPNPNFRNQEFFVKNQELIRRFFLKNQEKNQEVFPKNRRQSGDFVKKSGGTSEGFFKIRLHKRTSDSFLLEKQNCHCYKLLWLVSIKRVMGIIVLQVK
jgi:hypothetical protein